MNIIYICVGKSSQTDNVAVLVMWRKWFGGRIQHADNARPASKTRSMPIVRTFSLFSLFLFLSCARARRTVIIVSFWKKFNEWSNTIWSVLVWNRKIETECKTPVFIRLLKLFKFPTEQRVFARNFSGHSFFPLASFYVPGCLVWFVCKIT